jgi:rubredoxin
MKKEDFRPMEKITWKCPKCGYTFEAEAGVTPPETCAGCKEKCQFVNVTCYVPECGFSGLDPRLGKPES